jgi:hypothetical protein
MSAGVPSGILFGEVHFGAHEDDTLLRCSILKHTVNSAGRLAPTVTCLT